MIRNIFKGAVLSKETALIIAPLLVAHIFLIAIYIAYLPKIHSLWRRNTAQSIINIIRLESVTPKELRNKVIPAINNIHVTMTKKPQWPWRFDGRNFNESLPMTSFSNQLITASKKEPEFLKLSYRLEAGKWINIKVDLHPYLHGLLWYVFIIELINIAVITSYLLVMRRFRKPLAYLKKFAENIKIDGNVNMLPVCGPTIMQDVTQAINKMQLRVTKILDQRKLTISALSHDLRTPITRLRLRAQFIENQTQQEKIIKDLDEMEKMLNDTILFAKQNNVVGKTKRNIEIISLIRSLCDEAADLKQPVTYEININRQAFFGNPTLLKRSFSNIINNAIKYGKVAHLCIQKRDDKLLITIDDKGPGMTEQEKNKAFDPFYRVESSRSKETGGSGLGLAITKSIITHHHGTIEMVNLPQKGLRVLVTLELANQEDCSQQQLEAECVVS